MKLILLGLIKLYWKLIPMEKRRSCLFKESCSRYVFRQTKEYGFFKGMTSFITRVKRCRPGYEIIIEENKASLLLKDKTIIPQSEINEHLLYDMQKYINLVCNK